MRIKDNPIRFGGCCDKCGRPKISCVCVQRIVVEKPMTEKQKLLLDLRMWHDIMQEFMKEYPPFSGPHPDFYEWLKTYYHSPIRRKK